MSSAATRFCVRKRNDMWLVYMAVPPRMGEEAVLHQIAEFETFDECLDMMRYTQQVRMLDVSPRLLNPNLKMFDVVCALWALVMLAIFIVHGMWAWTLLPALMLLYVARGIIAGYTR